MRKIFKVLIGGIILFGSSCISAQVNDVGTQKKNIVAFPTSANAYAMDKVGKLPIDMFRGKANINIPFYSISVDGLTIPISLSYNTGGIKLNEVASTVGLGWSLSIPNSISQSIMDKDDKSFSLYTKDINIVNSKVRSVGVYDNDIRQIVDDHYESIYDTRPDIFNYSLPIGSGSFLINNDTGYTIPHEDLLITATNNKKNIKIINTDGASFYLSLKNRTTVDSGIPNDNISSTETLYQIDSIKTTTNKKVIFEYGKVYSYEEKNITEKSNIKISDDIVQGIDSVLPPLPEHERYVGSVSNSEKIITKIIFPGGVIYFNYSNDGLPFSDGSVIRKDLSGNNGIALRQILVKDTNGKIIKDYRLNFSYFNSTNGNNTYSDYRLKLLNVYDNLQNSYHKFFYNETYSFPPRNSNNDDYWGYINSLTYGEGNSNIPDEIYTDYTLKHIAIPGIYSRNRDTNSEYSQIGILNRIEYPTKGSKYLYYETANKFFNKTNYQWGYIDNFATVLNAPAGGISDGFGDVNQSVTIPASFFQGKESPQVKLIFGNTCENNVDDETSQIHETSCYGNAMIGSSHYGTNGKPAVFELNYQSGQPINISLSRTGKCQCGYGIDVIYGKYNTVNTNVPIGGLRIKKVEDKNENNIVNTYNYKYEILDKTTNTYKSSGILNMPFQYTRLLKRYITEDTQGNKLPAPYIQKYLIISNSSANYNAYGSSDVITYKQVTEYNDLGENTSVFSQSNISDSDRLYTHVYSNYDEWKNGLLEKNIILNKANDTVKVETNEYVFNNLKNSKSGFTTLDLNQIGYAFNLDISKYNKLISSSTGVGDVNAVLYDVEKEFISINSGKVERVKSKTTEYLPGNKIIETVTKSSYYDTDINKPMNVKTVSTQSPDQSVSETTYQYAHEKNNQKLINANMIGIPLETTVVEKQNATASGKTIARSETLYNDPANLFPTSVLSYDLLNNTPSTEVTYNKYDSKGNLQQFTTKDGIPTAIVWGYNGTQPIVKIVGVTYNQLMSLGLITAIVNASDSDAANPANEPALITALDNFRKNSGLSSYQVSTYTYDPLIGVTSITPPSGIREVYIYDTANRLKEVRKDSKTGNLLKEFKYNYKN